MKKNLSALLLLIFISVFGLLQAQKYEVVWEMPRYSVDTTFDPDWFYFVEGAGPLPAMVDQFQQGKFKFYKDPEKKAVWSDREVLATLAPMLFDPRYNNGNLYLNVVDGKVRTVKQPPLFWWRPGCKDKVIGEEFQDIRGFPDSDVVRGEYQSFEEPYRVPSVEELMAQWEAGKTFEEIVTGMGSVPEFWFPLYNWSLGMKEDWKIKKGKLKTKPKMGYFAFRDRNEVNEGAAMWFEWKKVDFPWNDLTLGHGIGARKISQNSAVSVFNNRNFPLLVHAYRQKGDKKWTGTPVWETAYLGLPEKNVSNASCWEATRYPDLIQSYTPKTNQLSSITLILTRRDVMVSGLVFRNEELNHPSDEAIDRTMHFFEQVVDRLVEDLGSGENFGFAVDACFEYKTGVETVLERREPGYEAVGWPQGQVFELGKAQGACKNHPDDLMQVVQITGTLVREGSEVRFEPGFLELTWNDPEGVKPSRWFWAMPIERLPYEIEGKTPSEWLSTEDFAYTPIQVNGIGLSTLEEAWWVDFVLMEGRWEDLPGPANLGKSREMSEEERLERLRSVLGR